MSVSTWVAASLLGTSSPSLPAWLQGGSIRTDGWTFNAVSTPPSTVIEYGLNVTRPGFDDNGNTANIPEILTVTKRVRQVYPNQTSLTALIVSASDYLIQGDQITGITNNSTETMPKPIANWAMLDRQLIGETGIAEVTGNHWAARNGRPFRAVKFRWTDKNGLFVEQTVNNMTVSGQNGDKNAVLVYRCETNISTLEDGLITLRAWVYPWVGGASSVADSNDSSIAREFSPRYFLKNVSRFTNPPYAYVSSTPSGSPVVSTNHNDAKANPFGSIQAAIDGLITAVGNVDGCRIRVMNSVNMGSNATVGKAQQCAAVIVERDPDVIKANAVVSLAATWRGRLGVGTLLSPLTEGAILFRDCTLTRAGLFTFQGETATPLRVMITDDVNLNNNNQNASWLNNSHLYLSGAIVTNATGSSVFNAATGEIRMFRGVSVARAGAAIEGWLVLGSTITNPGQCTYGTRSESGSIIQFNRFINYNSTTNAIVAWANSNSISTPVSNCSFSQNLVEVIHTTTSNPSVRASSDSSWQPVTHILIDNNTIASGHFQAGRMNLFYDETQLVNRTLKFCRVKNTVAGGFYIKSDVFVGENGNGSPNPTDAPNHTGNWAATYGVGFKNLVTMLVNLGANIVGENEGPEYPGLGSTIAASQTVQNPATTAWTDWQATTTNTGTGAAVAGTGNGVYTLPSGSPLIGRVSPSDEIFPFDLAGVSRTRGSVGAYA